MGNPKTHSTMPVSVLNESQLPVAVVAHDAGAANLILAWMGCLPASQVRLCAAGPAANLHRATHPHLVNLTLSEALREVRSVLTGTSGPLCSLEHEARKIARTRGLPSFGVIDHWVNYSLRFTRDGEQVLPDEIWVTDGYAAELARAHFPSTPVREQHNSYLENLVAEVHAADLRATGETHVLYALEPIRSNWGRGDVHGEFQALDFFMKHRLSLGIGPEATIRLRPHPSEAPGKYATWLAAQQHACLKIDSSPSLAAAVGWSDWVIGCESYALVAGIAAGRRVVSTLPDWAPHCRLPHAEIVHLRTFTSGSTPAERSPHILPVPAFSG